MRNMCNLLESTNMARGFTGGQAVDRLPHLTLIEAATQLPCIIVESQIDFIQARTSDHRAISEATTEILIEASIGTIRDKVEAFFERVLKWIRSIIAKLKVQVERITLSGQELYEKYADKLGKGAVAHRL